MDEHQNSGRAHCGFLLEGGWLVQPELNLISRNGEQHRVHGKHMDVLVCLGKRGGMVSRRELFDAVWPDQVVVEECLTRAVSELRKVFGDDPRHPHVIETIPKRGYRLLVPALPVTRVEAVSLGPTTPSPTPEGAGRSWPRSAAVAGPLGLLGLAAVILAQMLGAAAAPRSNIPTVVQLTSLPGRESFPALSPSGDRLAFVWDKGEANPLQALYVADSLGGEPRRLTPIAGRFGWPAWSHDTRLIAYVRVDDETTDICAVPAGGGDERILVAGTEGTYPLTPDFSPDGRWLAFSAVYPEGMRGIVLQHLKTGEQHRLTEPEEAPWSDVRPRFSADSRRVAFLRAGPEGLSIAVVLAEGGEATPLRVGDRQPADLAWDPSSDDAILFTAYDGLWRISTRGDVPQLVSPGNGSKLHLAAARESRLVAWVEAVEDRDIWRSDLVNGTTPSEPRLLISSSRLDALPSWSHDGRSIAFVSDRSGEPQLWITDSNGGELRQLTRYRNTVVRSPTWSPDDTTLAHVAILEGQARVCTVDVRTGGVTVLSEPGPHEMAPSWSTDGRWIYLSRLEDGAWRIARRPSGGGPAIDLTSGPSFGAMEAPGGSELYYSRMADGVAGLWSLSLDDRSEQQRLVLPHAQLVSWTLGRKGIYYCFHQSPEDQRFVIAFRGFASAIDETLLTVRARSRPSFDVSPDETAVLFDRAERSESDIVGLAGDDRHRT